MWGASFLKRLAISVQNSDLTTVKASTGLLLFPGFKPQLIWQLMLGTVLRALHVCIPRILART